METRETLTMPPQANNPPVPRVLFCRGFDGLSLYDIGPDGAATRLFTIHDVGPTADKHKERQHHVH